MKNLLNIFVREERGQDLIEYTLLIVASAFLGLALVGAVTDPLKSGWKDTSTQIGKVSATVNPSAPTP